MRSGEKQTEGYILEGNVGRGVGTAHKRVGKKERVKEGLKRKEGAGSVRSCKYTFAGDISEMGRDSPPPE